MAKGRRPPVNGVSSASSPQATTRRRLAIASVVVLAAGVAGALYWGSQRTAGRDILAVTRSRTSPGDDRHAARRCAGLRRRTGADAEHRCDCRGGVRFSFAHAQAVVTLPSHASILTGTYPFQHGYRENSGYRLKPGMPTLATILKGRGFATGAFVAAFRSTRGSG